jgi:hypothetical protein
MDFLEVEGVVECSADPDGRPYSLAPRPFCPIIIQTKIINVGNPNNDENEK